MKRLFQRVAMVIVAVAVLAAGLAMPASANDYLNAPGGALKVTSKGKVQQKTAYRICYKNISPDAQAAAFENPATDVVVRDYRVAPGERGCMKLRLQSGTAPELRLSTKAIGLSEVYRTIWKQEVQRRAKAKRDVLSRKITAGGNYLVTVRNRAPYAKTFTLKVWRKGGLRLEDSRRLGPGQSGPLMSDVLPSRGRGVFVDVYDGRAYPLERDRKKR